MPETPSFREELQHLLNKHSKDAVSDTPDFILASFLENILMDWRVAVSDRDQWATDGMMAHAAAEPPGTSPDRYSLLPPSSANQAMQFPSMDLRKFDEPTTYSLIPEERRSRALAAAASVLHGTLATSDQVILRAKKFEEYLEG